MLSTSLRAVPLVYVILFIFVNQNLLNGENKSEVIKMINEWQPRISLWNLAAILKDENLLPTNR